MGAMVDDTESVLSIWNDLDFWNSLSCASIGGIAAVVNAYTLDEKGIRNWRCASAIVSLRCEKVGYDSVG